MMVVYFLAKVTSVNLSCVGEELTGASLSLARPFLAAHSIHPESFDEEGSYQSSRDALSTWKVPLLPIGVVARDWIDDVGRLGRDSAINTR